MKILAIVGSNSESSINKKLVTYATQLFSNATSEIVDMNAFEMPIYKNQREASTGIPCEATLLAQKIDEADLVLVALAEHNGSYSASFKNVFDWVSRIPNRPVWNAKPLFLMATAPGPRGGLGVLEAAAARFPYHGGEVLETFSLPKFGENFDADQMKISLPEKEQELSEKIKQIELKF